MTGTAERGRADAVALVLAALLGGTGVAAALIARAAPPADAPPHPPSSVPSASAAAPLRAAAGALEAAPAPPEFAGRRLGPPAPAAAPPPRVRSLDAAVTDGRIEARWTPAAGSPATTVRVSGLGGPGALERELAAPTGVFRAPVRAVAGTAIVTARPTGAPASAEERVSVPFRVPVEILRAESASPDGRSAILVLRRPFDGRPVEAAFPVGESDTVGGLSSVPGEATPVDFQTEYVLEAVRLLAPPPGPTVDVPRFLPDGRVRRGEDGTPDMVARTLPGTGPAIPEVVLRGPNEERRILRAPAHGQRPGR